MLRERLNESLRLGQTAEVLAAADAYFHEHPDPSAEALWVAAYACRAAGARGQWGQAVRWSEQAKALKVKETEAEGWIQLVLGAAQMYLGNAYRAEKALAAFDRLARRSPRLRSLQPYADFNRAILMRFLRRHAEEIASLQKASQGFTALDCARESLQCRLEIAWAHLLQSEPGLALPELDEASRLLGTGGDADLKTDAAIGWALYYRLTGDLDRAERLCQEVLNNVALPPRQEADALWIAGCVARARGDLAQARQLGDEAHRIAARDYWPMQVERIEALRSVAIAN
ncbi:MAG TPA: hypothetical protein VD969_05815 [Symbiobacteriaceae bacterium]|nr:hypothetical protein [Symbiobacteriaceae bacterium]